MISSHTQLIQDNLVCIRVGHGVYTVICEHVNVTHKVYQLGHLDCGVWVIES